MSNKTDEITLTSLLIDEGYRNHIFRNRLDEIKLRPDIHQSKDLLHSTVANNVSIAHILYEQDWWANTDAATDIEIALIKGSQHSSFAFSRAKCPLNVFLQPEFQRVDVLNINGLANKIPLISSLTASHSWDIWLSSGDITYKDELWNSRGGQKALKNLMTRVGDYSQTISLMEKLASNNIAIAEYVDRELLEESIITIKNNITSINPFEQLHEYFGTYQEKINGVFDMFNSGGISLTESLLKLACLANNSKLFLESGLAEALRFTNETASEVSSNINGDLENVLQYFYSYHKEQLLNTVVNDNKFSEINEFIHKFQSRALIDDLPEDETGHVDTPFKY